MIDLQATEIHPVLLDVIDQVKLSGTAQEALAVVIDLWNDLLALEINNAND